MFICIANNENKFLVIDTSDGVCEWTTIQRCRRYLEHGIRIIGLSLVNLDSVHSYIRYSPSNDFIPRKILDEFKLRCNNIDDYNKLVFLTKRYILSGNNIITMRIASGSYMMFKNNLLRWCYNG